MHKVYYSNYERKLKDWELENLSFEEEEAFLNDLSPAMRAAFVCTAVKKEPLPCK